MNHRRLLDQQEKSHPTHHHDQVPAFSLLPKPENSESRYQKSKDE